jgi:hypothetical protein
MCDESILYATKIGNLLHINLCTISTPQKQTLEIILNSKKNKNQYGNAKALDVH